MKTKLLLALFSFVIILQASGQNTWTQKASLTGIQRAASIAFTIDSVAYLGLGYNFSQFPAQQTDLWKYSPVADSWTQVASKPGAGLSAASAFSIGGKGYVVGGFNSSSVVSELWEYDAVLNSWTQKTSCPGAGRDYAVAFSIGSKGYFGTGYDASSQNFNDFWEYTPSTDSWLQRADVPGLPRSSAIGFSIGNYGYVGSGYIATGVNDFWRYDPQSNSWTQKANIGTQGISDGTGFAIGGEGYICTGYINSTASGDLLEYDTLLDTWTPMITLTGPSRSNAVGFAIGNKGYISCGNDVAFTHLNDLWEYTPSSIITSVNNEKQPTQNTLSVFPFVTSNAITIHCPAAAAGSQVAVINIKGQTLVEKTFSKSEVVDASSYPAGMYFVQVKTTSGNYASRFLKE
jgi:N-acetylneuraminic acid mutarotase